MDGWNGRRAGRSGARRRHAPHVAGIPQAPACRLRVAPLEPCPVAHAQVVHRLAVFDAHGDIINVVSQTGKLGRRWDPAAAMPSAGMPRGAWEPALLLGRLGEWATFEGPRGAESAHLAGVPEANVQAKWSPPRPLPPFRRRPTTLGADIMRFLLSHIDELGGVADKSLEQLGMLTGGSCPGRMPRGGAVLWRQSRLPKRETPNSWGQAARCACSLLETASMERKTWHNASGLSREASQMHAWQEKPSRCLPRCRSCPFRRSAPCVRMPMRQVAWPCPSACHARLPCPRALAAGKPPVLSVNPHVPALLAYAQLASQQVGGGGYMVFAATE